jgi:hypothetical protein
MNEVTLTAFVDLEAQVLLCRLLPPLRSGFVVKRRLHENALQIFLNFF